LPIFHYDWQFSKDIKLRTAQTRMDLRTSAFRQAPDRISHHGANKIMNEQISTERGAAIYSPLVLKLYDWWVLGISNRFAWQCPTSTTLLPFFAQHMGRRHMDVGVGTGFYLANARLPSSTHITLLDLNENSLRAAAARSRVPVSCIRHDIMQPLPLAEQESFDSISMFYLLHCLPGSFDDKEKAIANLKTRLAPSGSLYGATILGDGAEHNWFGRRLMAAYNRKGIFGNAKDSMAALRSMLQRHFGEVETRQEGKVALFVARVPH
jgi:SAM-dependent methyltransferase